MFHPENPQRSARVQGKDDRRPRVRNLKLLARAIRHRMILRWANRAFEPLPGKGHSQQDPQITANRMCASILRRHSPNNSKWVSLECLDPDSVSEIPASDAFMPAFKCASLQAFGDAARSQPKHELTPRKRADALFRLLRIQRICEIRVVVKSRANILENSAH